LEKIITPTNKRGKELHDKLGEDTKALREILFPPTKLIIINPITCKFKGINGISKKRIFRNYVKVEDPSILMLQERKCVG
jgi:hypothetical protein